MKLHSKTALFIIAVVMLPWFANDSRACRCMLPGPPCQEYWTTPAVFVGLVKDIALSSTDLGDGNNPRPYPRRSVHFSLEEAFRGVEGKEVEASTGAGGGDCGYDFKVGERYLVYAHRNSENNRLSVGICSRTRPLSEASEDLEYIRGVAKAPTGGRIFGQVKQYAKDMKDEASGPRTPMVDARVIIEGQDKGYEVTTDSQGRYHMSGLPAGGYQVRVVIPDYLGGQSEEKVNVVERGCAEANFLVQFDGQVSGIVTDSEGKPMPDVTVNLIVAGLTDTETSAPKGEMTSTNEAGRYVFNLIPPGRYLLGINLMYPPQMEHPYTSTYYPGVGDQAQATVIAMGKGSKLNGYDLRLPPRLIERAIEGVVMWPGGRSRGKVMVSIEAEEYPWWIRNSVEADGQGRFSIKALEGVKYLVHADLLENGYTTMHAEPVQVMVNEKTGPIKLAITLDGSSHSRNRRRK